MQCHGARHGDRAGGPDAAGVTDTIGPVTAALKLGGVSIAFGTWPANNWTPGSKGRVALRVDNLTDNRATGVYPYVLEVTITTASGSVTSSATGQFVVVNVATGLLCAGWALAGLERLDLTNGARLLWYNGDGNFRVYTQRACSVAPNRVCGAPSASYPDSIREVAGTYVRLLPDSVSVTFGSIGEHLTTRNAKGHVTTFVYDAFGRPSQIAVPPDPVATALTWTFDYGANGLLASSTAPGDPTSRMVTAHLNAATVRPDPDRTAPIFPKASRLECAARQVSPPSPLETTPTPLPRSLPDASPPSGIDDRMVILRTREPSASRAALPRAPHARSR